MRTFFRDKFSDPAALADLMVFGGRELSYSRGNRDVTTSKDKAFGGLWNHTPNDFGASKAPAGLDLVQGCLTIVSLRVKCNTVSL